MKKHSIYLDKKKEFTEKNNSLSPEIFNFYKKVYAAQERFSDALPDDISALFKITGGSFPALKSDGVSLNSSYAASLFKLLEGITAAVTEINPGMDFRLLADSFKSSANEILKSVIDHNFDDLEKKAAETRLDLDEYLFVIHNTFKPLLVRLRELHSISVNKEDWLSGECPFCGYFPDFSKIIELKENHRKLHCSLCENEWEFPRLRCHACGTDVQESLGYFEYEDSPEYRVYYCNSCRKYIKSIRVQKMKEEEGYDLAVEDIVTGFLDITMMEKDYNRL